MNPNGAEAFVPELTLSVTQESQPTLDFFTEESAQVSMFPSGNTALDHQLHHFYRWADRKLHTPIGGYLQSLKLGPVHLAENARQEENAKTLELYKETFSSFLWTGIECSNPQSPNGERWDQLELTRFYDLKHRTRQIQLMQASGIENVRLGMPNHKMVEQKNWRCFSRILNDFKEASLKVSLDLQHFGLPASFRNASNPEESVYLNPAWPEHYVKFALKSVKRYLPDLEALTLINEPMITNRFSSCFWNEAIPGTMHDERYNYFFIKRSLLIAKAAVKARYEIERHLQTQKKNRIIFIHNESCERHVDNPDFNEFGRFLASDLILGHEWLLADDFTQTSVFAWILKHVVRTEQQEEDTEKLLRDLSELKSLHKTFESQFGKTMKADTVFGIDYYAACETVKLTCGFPKPTSIDSYTEETESGQRLGLAGICVEYWNRYQLPLLHTETNFVTQDLPSTIGTSDDWGTKQLLELGQLPKLGIPILGFTWYSLMDQFNWHNGMQGSPQDIYLHPVGLYSWPDYQARPFAANVLPALLEELNPDSRPVNIFEVTASESETEYLRA